MIAYLPFVVIVAANTFYHVCAKSLPEGMNSFASLAITYAIGAIVSIVALLVTSGGKGSLLELTKTNWAPIALGVAVVGLELGNILMYQAGWQVNTGFLVSSTLCSMALIAIGFLLYGEPITLTKVAGVLICLVGLGVINL